MLQNDPAIIDEMLRGARNIAVVGMSDKPHRDSHHVGRYLAEHGYRVFPVNPALKEVLGGPCYADLDAAQAAARELTGSGIDLVDVFRASEYVPPIVDDVIRLAHSLPLAAGRSGSRRSRGARPRSGRQVRAE